VCVCVCICGTERKKGERGKKRVVARDRRTKPKRTILFVFLVIHDQRQRPAHRRYRLGDKSERRSLVTERQRRRRAFEERRGKVPQWRREKKMVAFNRRGGQNSHEEVFCLLDFQCLIWTFNGQIYHTQFPSLLLCGGVAEL
jgi:hypothetical protein